MRTPAQKEARRAYNAGPGRAKILARIRNPDRIKRRREQRQAWRNSLSLKEKQAFDRRANLKKYALTQKVSEIVRQQGGCAICAASKPGSKRNVWHVDHDHKTGHTRGVLCHHCNLGLGMFKDDPVRLARAARYIQMFAELSNFI